MRRESHSRAWSDGTRLRLKADRVVTVPVSGPFSVPVQTCRNFLFFGSKRFQLLLYNGSNWRST